MVTRAGLYGLIDTLPEDKYEAAVEALLAVGATLLPPSFMNAEFDDEPLTEEDRAAIAEARAEVRRGEYVTWDEIKDRWLRDDPCPGE
jgi:hypothetical protein